MFLRGPVKEFPLFWSRKLPGEASDIEARMVTSYGMKQVFLWWWDPRGSTAVAGTVARAAHLEPRPGLRASGATAWWNHTFLEWRCVTYVWLSWTRGTPKSSGFHRIIHCKNICGWGTPIYGNPHMTRAESFAQVFFSAISHGLHDLHLKRLADLRCAVEC